MAVGNVHWLRGPFGTGSASAGRQVWGLVCAIAIKRLQGHFPLFIPVMATAKLG